MKTPLIVAAGALALGLAAYLTLKPSPEVPAEQMTRMSSPTSDLVEVALPETLSPDAQIGKRAFDATCAACHGANAAGRDGFGPPLVHIIYEPSHHGDMAFLYAVQRGVQAHHWRFGNMPPQEGLTTADVQAIVTYVRELQRANGID